MSRNQILIVLLGLMAITGVVDATYASHGGSQPILTVPLSLCISFLIFLWYRNDSDERNYRRSLWLNAGVIMFAFFVVPYYLVRSRPRGQKLRALLRFAGFALLMLLATAAGMLLSGHALG